MRLPAPLRQFLDKFRDREFTGGDLATHLRLRDSRQVMAQLARDGLIERCPASAHSPAIYRVNTGERR